MTKKKTVDTPEQKTAKLWTRAKGINTLVRHLREDARNGGEHDLADVLKRVEREFNHPSYTDAEMRQDV